MPAAGAASGPRGSRQGQEHRAASRSTTRSRDVTSATRSFGSSTSAVSNRTACSSAPPSVSWRLAPAPRDAARSSTSSPTSSSSSIASIPEHRTVDTFITTVSPMDDDGYFSLGTNSDYSCVMSPPVPRASSSRSTGTCRRCAVPAQIHVSEVAAIVENDTPLEEFPVAAAEGAGPDRRAQCRRADSRRRHAADGNWQPAQRRLPRARSPQRPRHPHRAADPADGEADGAGDRHQPVQEARHRQDDLHLRARRSPSLRLHERASRHRGPSRSPTSTIPR